MAKKKKKYFRAGNVVALKQGDFYTNWWTLIPNVTDPDMGVIQVSTGTTIVDSDIDNLITVLNKIKKQGE